MAGRPENDDPPEYARTRDAPTDGQAENLLPPHVRQRHKTVCRFNRSVLQTMQRLLLLLRYTVLSTGCAPLLQCLGRLSLPPFVGR